MDKTNKSPENRLARSGPAPKVHTVFSATAGRVLTLCVLALTVACSPGENTGSASSGKLKVADKYQEHLEKDRQRVEEGKAPSCAQVFGHANVALNIDEKGNATEAMQAIEACYVQLSARHITGLLQSIQAGDADCNQLLIQGSSSRRVMRTVLQGMKVDTAPLDQQFSTLVREDVERQCPRASTLFDV